MDKPETTDGEYLEGQMLIAMPGMTDPRFERSVIFLCAHNPEGAMGIVVNKLVDEFSFRDLLKQLDIEPGEAAPDLDVHFGGPVESQCGFVLHSPDYRQDNTLVVDDRICVTTTLDILRSMARGSGPARSIFALGYAGWGPGQLEGEIHENAWLHAPLDEDLVFDNGVEDKWKRAMNSIGVDVFTLSGAAGRA